MILNPRVGFYYTVGAIVLLTITLLTRPFGWIILWPTLSVSLVAIGYFGLGSSVYAKQNGKHPLWARMLHWFTMQGHEISRRAYARKCAPWDRLLPSLWIGRQLSKTEVDALKREGATAVLDLTAEFSEPESISSMHYRSLPLLDLTAPSNLQLESAIEFIQREIKDGCVYVHCKIGYSRTAAVAGSYLIYSGQAQSAGEAMKMLRKARPSIVIRPEARSTIQRYAQRCHAS